MARQADLPTIVLVRPRNAFNIGAAARVMTNFGFKDLRIVSPYPPIWGIAKKGGVGADAMIKRSRVYKTVAEAIADRRYVLGASAFKNRALTQTVYPLMSTSPKRSWAVLFGPENAGLSTDDLSHCQGLLNIPTQSKQLSMNLAQAVCCVCYEWGGRARRKVLPPEDRVGAGNLERLIVRSEEALRWLGYRPRLTPKARAQRLRRLLRPRGASVEEAGFLFEVLRRLQEKKKAGSK
jgi:TrmH family RNA methyltransferase